MSDDLTPRERRAQNAKKGGPKMDAINWNKAIAPLLVLALLGLVFGMVYYNAVKEETCPGHWHSSFGVYVNDERVSYVHDEFTLESGGLPLRHHMHRGEGASQIHWEPTVTECLKMGDFLKDIDTTINPADQSLLLEGAHEDLGQGGWFIADQNNTLKTYYKTPTGEWTEIGLKAFLDRQPKDGERQLIVYGNPDEARLMQMQETIAYPRASPNPNHPGQ